MSSRRANRAEALAAFTTAHLREETHLAAFSINGWNTHANQRHTLPNALRELSTAILTPRRNLGPVWT